MSHRLNILVLSTADMSISQTFYPTVAIEITDGLAEVQCQTKLGICFPDLRLHIPCKTSIRIIEKCGPEFTSPIVMFKVSKTEVQASSKTIKKSKTTEDGKNREGLGSLSESVRNLQNQLNIPIKLEPGSQTRQTENENLDVSVYRKHAALDPENANVEGDLWTNYCNAFVDGRAEDLYFSVPCTLLEFAGVVYVNLMQGITGTNSPIRFPQFTKMRMVFCPSLRFGESTLTVSVPMAIQASALKLQNSFSKVPVNSITDTNSGTESDYKNVLISGPIVGSLETNLTQSLKRVTTTENSTSTDDLISFSEYEVKRTRKSKNQATSSDRKGNSSISGADSPKGNYENTTSNPILPSATLPYVYSKAAAIRSANLEQLRKSGGTSEKQDRSAGSLDKIGKFVQAELEQRDFK